MTMEQVAALGPAFTKYLRSFKSCFVNQASVEHMERYCCGLISDLPRKSVEPIALAAGCTVRTLQQFLADYVWDHDAMRDEIQRRIVRDHLPAPGEKPAGGVGTVGWTDETSTAKKGDKTPGVQRQYCGASGKIDNCIVTVHLACQCGDFMALLDRDLFLPKESWDQDRDRCQEAHVPDDVTYRSKWQIALEQITRAMGNGVRFDWLTFDEWYEANPDSSPGLKGWDNCMSAKSPAISRASRLIPSTSPSSDPSHPSGPTTPAPSANRSRASRGRKSNWPAKHCRRRSGRSEPARSIWPEMGNPPGEPTG